MNLPPAPGRGVLWLTAKTYNAIRELLARPELTPDPSQFATITRANQKTFRLTHLPEAVTGPGGSSTASGAWRLILSQDNSENWQWSVSAEKSTIIDGTNGDEIALGSIFDQPTTIAGLKYISLKGTVDPETLAISEGGWAFAATEDKPKEIEFDAEDPPGQIGLHLVIGKITFPSEGSPFVQQLATLPQRIVMVFLDGEICKGITSV